VRRLLILGLLLLAGCCTQCPKPEDKPAQNPLAAPAPEPCRYQVVYRDRGTWVDPTFVAIDRSKEYLLEKRRK
jgi:hypothetical protein